MNCSNLFLLLVRICASYLETGFHISNFVHIVVLKVGLLASTFGPKIISTNDSHLKMIKHKYINHEGKVGQKKENH